MRTFLLDRSIRTENNSPQTWKLCSEHHYYHQRLFLYFFFLEILFFLVCCVCFSNIAHVCAHTVSDSLLSFFDVSLSSFVHVVCCGGAIFSFFSFSVSFFLLVVLHVCVYVCYLFSVFLCWHTHVCLINAKKKREPSFWCLRNWIEY